MNDAANHDANHGTTDGGKTWHCWCPCGWNGGIDTFRKPRFTLERAAIGAVYDHLRMFDPERAHRYALDKGLLGKRPAA